MQVKDELLVGEIGVGAEVAARSSPVAQKVAPVAANVASVPAVEGPSEGRGGGGVVFGGDLRGERKRGLVVIDFEM